MVDFIGIRHVGFGVKDPAALAAFYRDVLGMKVITELPADSHMGATEFLARHPDELEHHDLVLFSNPSFAHTAFEIGSLGELLASHRDVKEKGVPIKFTFNHGFWLSFYIDDPEGHNLEFFWRTGAWVPNDFQVMPINLDRAESEIMAEVEALRAYFADGKRTSAAEWNTEHGWGTGQQNWNPNPQNRPQWGLGQRANQGNAGQWGTGDWNQRVIEEFRANGGKVAMLPTPVLLLTTTGRKSGKSYTTPIGYMKDADRLIVVPSNKKADWYLNALAHPEVQVEFGSESFMATAALVEGEQKTVFLEQARRIAATAMSVWRPAEAGDMADHVPEDGPVVALQRV